MVHTRDEEKDHLYYRVSYFFQNDIIGCAQQVEMLVNQLTARMEQLQQTVQSKTAVPTAQVYVSLFILYKDEAHKTHQHR